MSPQPSTPGDTIARKALSKRQAPSPAAGLLTLIERSLDDDQAEDIAVIDMAGKSAIADFMVIATGRSSRHVASMAEHLRERVKAFTGHPTPVEGLAQADWVLVDAGDVIVHLFRAEVRAYYNLEKMWSRALPDTQDPMVGLVKEKIVAEKLAKIKRRPAGTTAVKKPVRKTAAKAPVGKAPVRKAPVGKAQGGKALAKKPTTKKPAAKSANAGKKKPAAARPRRAAD